MMSPYATSNRKPTAPAYVIDLFAGCGGLSLGLESAGFMPLLVNEINTYALSTYLQNRVSKFPHLADPQYHIEDVKRMVLDEKFLPNLVKRLRSDFGIAEGEIDLVVGGPPCQGYSGIGHRRSYSVEKEQLPSNHLYQDMAAVVHKLRPRAFLFENVRGLLSARWTTNSPKGEIWEDVKRTFGGIPGYRIAASLVRAKDYGVPQNRPRVLLVGLRDDSAFGSDLGAADAVECGFLPRPSKLTAPDLIDLLGDLVDPNYTNGGETRTYPSPARNSVQRQFRQVAGSARPAAKGDPVSEHQYSRHSPKIAAKFKAMHERNGEIPKAFRTKKFAQRLLPPRWGPSGPTITATSLPDDYVHYCQPRTLTVREWARLQTFPDWYSFSGPRTTGGLRRAGNPQQGLFDRELPKYTQIGNAVPVSLAYQVGLHLRTLLTR